MNTTRIRNIFKMIMSTHEADITCDECFEHVDRYAEMLLAGGEPDEVLLKVQRHLENCHCCEKEFEALMVILKAQTDQE